MLFTQGNDAPTNEFCSGTVCPRMISSAFDTCGLSAHSTLIQKGICLQFYDSPDSSFIYAYIKDVLLMKWAAIVEMLLID